MDEINIIIAKILNWTKLKCRIHINAPKAIFFDEREIWWAHLGQNVGSEQNGANEKFDRPVLIIKKFSKDILWILPMTTTGKEGPYYFPTSFSGDQKQSKVLLSQIRTISSLRLIKKQRTLPGSEFEEIKKRIRKMLI